MQLPEVKLFPEVILFASIITSFAKCSNGLFATLLKCCLAMYLLSQHERITTGFSRRYSPLRTYVHSDIYESLARKLDESKRSFINHPCHETCPLFFA